MRFRYMDIERIIKLGLLLIVEGAIGIWGIATIINTNVAYLYKFIFVLFVVLLLLMDAILFSKGKI